MMHYLLVRILRSKNSVVIKTISTTNSVRGFCSAWLSDSCWKHIGNFKLFQKLEGQTEAKDTQKNHNFDLDGDKKKAKRLSKSGANLYQGYYYHHRELKKKNTQVEEYQPASGSHA